MNHQPSPHLTWEELSCHDRMRTPYPNDYMVHPLGELRDAFELVRDELSFKMSRDCPITILSAYRTPAYNRQVGGEKGSYHVKGMALDMSCGKAMSVFDFAQLVVRVAKQFKVIRGVGYYPDNGFVHMDVRPVPDLVLWIVTYEHGIRPWNGVSAV